ncbi:decapping and exoribonuclease protein-like [Mycetomoellerius zeteki]|uniref:decapping and exoribonuclease protein-like n=1 Tax=Mycetomoellerius zeteki TaxID=64791 RepID=UPI00084EAFC9|nr:PREDICTED: decapping and exoribonuclease protein-like [Trachymyrmex zeteki]
MSFQIDFINFSEKIIPTLTAELIGYFSIDGDMQYHADLSQLKYYIPPSDPNNVNFDLNKNFMFTRHRPTSYLKLDKVLRWLSNNFHRLEKPVLVQEERWLDIDFIASRGTIKTILCSPYKMRDEWIICASKYRGTIYLCEFYSDEREHHYANASMSERQIHSWGYKFEQYMVADHPSHTPDLKQPLNECEQFYCMFKANFDNHSLLYGAEIDGISSQQPITDTLEGKTLELIELKTFPLLLNEDGNIKISSLRVMEWWSQSYLVHINKIICGLKEKNIVRMIKEYSMCDLPKLSEPSCDINRSKIFCKIFLDNVKRIVIKDYDECMYKFHWTPFNKDVVNYTEEASDNKKYFFLQSWFVDKAEKYKRRFQ